MGNEVLSDPARGGFYASQDADQTLDDDGDYFTWTRRSSRSAVAGRISRGRALLRHRPARRDAPQPREKCPLDRGTIEASARNWKWTKSNARILLARAKGKLLAARRERRPTPTIDQTLYVGWNAMFVSAYLEAARVLDRADCREFALKTLDRILAEAWDESKGFLHRVGGPRLEGSLDDQVFAAAALLDAYESTLDRRYFDIAEHAMRLAVERFGDPDGGGFFDRAKDAAPMGGLDVRRKPLQDSPTPGANSVAAIVLDRLHGFTGEHLYREWAEKTLEAFVGLVPQYGLFAATYGLAALLHARHPMQVIVTGVAGDPKAASLEQAAHSVYRYGKAILRVTPEQLATAALPSALRETLPHLDATMAQAFVCVETTCHPPVSDPAKLATLLVEAASGARSAS